MVDFPQLGGCVCGDIRFALSEDPVLVYACHCTDCQKETGSAFAHLVVVRAEALEFTQGKPETWQVELADGRTKGASYCARCTADLGGNAGDGLAGIYAGTFDDTSWLEPAGHIWTDSAQPWIRLPEQSLKFPGQPEQEHFLDITRAWKARAQ